MEIICQRRRVSWSDLSPELLVSIPERLETRIDILHFRSVCKSWRASAPLSLLTSGSDSILSPLFSHTLPYRTVDLSTLVLVANSIFIVRSVDNHKLSPWLFTVEEFNPGKLSIRFPLSNYVAENLPKDFLEFLDLSNFQLSELGRFHTLSCVYSNSRRDDSNNSLRPKKRQYSASKVVLVVDPDCKTFPTTNDYSVVDMYGVGGLFVRRLRTGEKHKVPFEGRKLDDVVNFKGKIYAIDRVGRVFSMDYHSLKVSTVQDSLCEVYRWWKKGVPAFKVFKLNVKEEKWDYVDGIGDDRILFVTFDGCFFASSKDFPGWRGNCIVFSRGSFSSYSGPNHDRNIFKGNKHNYYHDVAVFHLEGGDYGPVSSYPGYANVFWPPPSWLWTNEGLSKGGSDCGGEEDDVIEVDPQSYYSRRKGMSSNSVQVSKALQTGQCDTSINEFKDPNNVDSAPLLNSLLKTFEKGVSKVKFAGVDVSSHLVPVLQKIWDKHGNIVEGHVVQSHSLLTWALESLANIFIILQSNSAKTLDDSLAEYLNSTLHDLQLLHFKLDWQVPFVGKPLVLHQEKVKNILELEMAESKLQAELQEVKKRLAEQRKLVPESQLGSASLDVNDALG